MFFHILRNLDKQLAGKYVCTHLLTKWIFISVLMRHALITQHLSIPQANEIHRVLR